MLSWEPAFLPPPMIISHHFPCCFKCHLAFLKAKNPKPNLVCNNQSQSWWFLCSDCDTPKSLLHSSTFPAAPHSPAAPTGLSPFRAGLQHPHSFAPNRVFPHHPERIPLEAARYGALPPVQTSCNTCFCSSHMPSRPQSTGVLGWWKQPGTIPAHSVACSVRGHMGPWLQCADKGRHKEGTQQSCAIGQGQPTPAPPPSPSTGLKIDVIRFQKGKEMERSSVMTLDMLWGCFSPGVAGPRWAPRWRFRTRSSRECALGTAISCGLCSGPSSFLSRPICLPAACNRLLPCPGKSTSGPQGSIPVSLLQSPHRANLSQPGTCQSHTDLGMLEPHSVPGGCREAPTVFLSWAHRCWLSMAGPHGCTALFDFAPNVTE